MNQNYSSIVLIITFLFILISNSYTQNRPSAPYIEKGVCPYEYGCDFTKWVATDQTKAYFIDGDTTNVAFLIEANDSLTFVSGNMYIEQVGIAILYRKYDKFLIGDTVYVLSYTGEGFYDIWHNGKFSNVEGFWNEDPPPTNKHFHAKLVVPPKMTWWVKLTNSENKSGWIPIINTCPTGGACFESNFDYSFKY